MGNFITFNSSPNTYNYNAQVKEDEVGMACSKLGREEESVHGFSGNARRKDATVKVRLSYRYNIG
jgi:hypothetical protein